MVCDLKPAIFIEKILNFIDKLDIVVDNVFSEQYFDFLEIERPTVEQVPADRGSCPEHDADPLSHFRLQLRQIQIRGELLVKEIVNCEFDLNFSFITERHDF